MILLPQLLECWIYVCHHTQVQFPFLKQQGKVTWYDDLALSLQVRHLGFGSLCSSIYQLFLCTLGMKWWPSHLFEDAILCMKYLAQRSAQQQTLLAVITVRGSSNIRYLQGIHWSTVFLFETIHISFLPTFINLECKTVLWETKWINIKSVAGNKANGAFATR